MRFSLTKAALALAALGTAIAQGPSSSGPNASSASSTPRPSSSGSANTNQTVLTTTITSFLPQGSGQSSAVPLTLTLTLNSTSPQAINETIANATMSGNDTLANGTMEWQEGDDWIPFNIIIDPAYGVLGALLILSGIPLAVLGGKNRWSSLAITTGYALMVFTLVMILALGVSPALQPPSPKPPTQLLRGLYLLACVLSAFVGAGLGVFLYKLAKYWVNAAGGFALAWYILALRPGGTIENVIGRWGLIGGMSVGAFIAGLPNPLNPYLVLLSTAWIGATAFILGVDCFTRAGLKEFYVYNLGFWNLFPKLNGKKYPLTQTMAIELGILAAVFLIGAAIQFRILNILQKRMKQMQEEEEARVDAEEVGKAAERFKNLEAEHAEWEEKYGSTSGGGGPSSSASGLGHKGDHSLDTPGAVDLPELQFSRDSNDKRFSSTHSLLSQTERQRYEPVGQISPTADTFPPQSQYQAQRNRSRTRLNEMDTNHAEELVGDGDDKADPALEEQMKLLEEVKKARLEVRSSLDKLRSSTPTALSPRDGTHSGGSTPTMDRFATGHTRQLSNASSNMLGRPVSILQRASPTSPGLPPINTAPSDQLVPPKSEWEQYVSSRNIVSPAPVASGAPSMYRQNSYDGYGYALGGSAAGSRPGSAMGMEFGGPQDIPLRERRQSSQTMPIAMARPSSNYDLRRPTSQYDLNRPVSQHETPVQQQRASYAPGTIIGSAAGAKYTAVTPGAGMTDGYAGRPAAVPRAMTYEELSDRHRKRMTQMQNPVSSKMNEEIELAAAKEKWEKQRRQERELMRRREAEKMQLVKEREQEAADAGRQGGMRGGAQRGKGEVMKSTDEWRRSVAGNLDQYAPPPQPQQLVHASSSGQIRGPGHGEVPRSPQRAARQQEEIKYGTAGRRRQSSHIAN